VCTGAIGGAENAGVENTGVENAGVDSKGFNVADGIATPFGFQHF